MKKYYYKYGFITRENLLYYFKNRRFKKSADGKPAWGSKTLKGYSIKELARDADRLCWIDAEYDKKPLGVWSQIIASCIVYEDGRGLSPDEHKELCKKIEDAALLIDEKRGITE